MPKLSRRNQGGETRFYGDFRDIGGGQHALVPDGAKRATTDELVAQRLLAEKTLELTGLPPGAAPGAEPTLKDFAGRFPRDNPGDVTERWLKETKLRLTRAGEFFGTDRELAPIRPRTSVAGSIDTSTFRTATNGTTSTPPQNSIGTPRSLRSSRSATIPSPASNASRAS